METKKCACGCGKEIVRTEDHIKRKRFPRYLKGHHNMGKVRELNANWKGGEEWQKKTTRARYERNYDKIYANQQKWNKRNKEKVRLYKKKWKERNKEKVKRKDHLYYIKNIKKFKTDRRERYLKNREKENKTSIIWSKQNRPKVIARQWYKRMNILSSNSKNEKELIMLYEAFQKANQLINKDQYVGLRRRNYEC